MLLLAVLVSVAIACDGPCVRFLSSDFDLRLAFPSHTVSPDVYSGADNPGQLRVDGTGRLDSQNRLFCNATGYRTHEFMENKCLAQRVLLSLGHVAREANMYCGWAERGRGGSAFRPRELVKALEHSAASTKMSWVLKSATDQASKNVLVMGPSKWANGSWTSSRVVEYARGVLSQPTMSMRCPDTKGHERRSVILQRKYPWDVQRREVLWFEVKVNVVWGRLGSGKCVLSMKKFGDGGSIAAEFGLYFDESGKLSMSFKGGGYRAAHMEASLMDRVEAILRREAPALQAVALSLSRLFGADYWRLDAFVSDGAPLHINELTYPSFYMSRSSLDMARLKSGYEQVAAGAIAPLSGACVLKQLERLTPGSLRDEAAAATAKVKACAPYMRQFAGAGGGEGKYRYRRGKAKGGGCDCMHKCVQACPLGLSAKLCDHMCTPQCSRHCGEEPFGH